MLRLPLASLALAAVAVVALVVFVVPAGSQSPSASPSPSASATPDPAPSTTELPTPLTTPVPTPTYDPKAPVEPEEWSPPAGYTGPLHPGVWVRVIGTGSCLNVRANPGTGTAPDANQPPGSGGYLSPVMNCLPDGFLGKLQFDNIYKNQMPVQADDHWWWYMLGQGWVAEDWLEFVQDGGTPYAPRPELAGAGLVAVSRTDGVWLVNADGSGERNVFPASDQSGITSLSWSPEGSTLAVGHTDYSKPPSMPQTTIIDVNGAVVAEFADMMEVRWSPTGVYLSAVHAVSQGGLGGWYGVPVVIELATGVVTDVGPQTFTYVSPEWAPDGSAVALLCFSSTWEEYNPDGSTTHRSTDCGGDGLRIVPLDGGAPRVVLPADTQNGVYYSNPSWSPDGSTIVVSSGGAGGSCNGYSLVDVASGSVTRCFSLPDLGTFGGMCGGSAESGASDWSPDGSTLAYHWQFRQGENGVALVNVATGERRMVLSTGASGVDFSPDGQYIIFSGSGYIWRADSDGTDSELLTEGWLAAWQPNPS